MNLSADSKQTKKKADDDEDIISGSVTPDTRYIVTSRQPFAGQACFCFLKNFLPNFSPANREGGGV